MLTYCYQRNHSKEILQTTAGEIITNSTSKLLSENHSKRYLKPITTEIIPGNTVTEEITTFKSLSDDSIHFKQYFLFIAHNTDNSSKTIIRKFITNSAFKSCLKPAASKAKGHIIYQNTNFSVDNQ